MTLYVCQAQECYMYFLCIGVHVQCHVMLWIILYVLIVYMHASGCMPLNCSATSSPYPDQGAWGQGCV